MRSIKESIEVTNKQNDLLSKRDSIMNRAYAITIALFTAILYTYYPPGVIFIIAYHVGYITFQLMTIYEIRENEYKNSLNIFKKLDNDIEKIKQAG